MNIVYIHGANASPTSFNFIRQNIDGPTLDLQYKSCDGFSHNLTMMHAKLDEMGGLDDIFFVAHSLGGIYALHLADKLKDRVRGAVTLSTPYGGSEFAQIAPLVLPGYNTQLMRDINPSSSPIRDGHAIKIKKPWTQVVTVGSSSSLMMGANDGVVTESSMRRRAGDMRLVDVGANHYEVILDMVALDIIKAAIADARVAA